jgi:hypothetical protein
MFGSRDPVRVLEREYTNWSTECEHENSRLMVLASRSLRSERHRATVRGYRI